MAAIDLRSLFYEIANAIRQKTGSTLPIPAYNFAEEIANIQSGSNIFSQTIVIDNQDAHLAQASQQTVVFDEVPVNSDIILLEIDGYNANATYVGHQTFSPWLEPTKYISRYIASGNATLNVGNFTTTNASFFCPLQSLDASSGEWTLKFKLPNQSTRFKSAFTFVLYYSPKNGREAVPSYGE